MSIDWESLFVPQVSIIELIIRGSLMYLALLAIFRFVVRRHTGTLGMADLLMIVLIADAAQNAMASEYRSAPEGLVLCGTIISWSYLLDWLAFRFPAARRWIEPPPRPLIREGLSQLREQGIEDIKEVKMAVAEPDGKNQCH